MNIIIGNSCILEFPIGLILIYITYDKRYKALNVPDKPHSVVFELEDVVDIVTA